MAAALGAGLATLSFRAPSAQPREEDYPLGVGMKWTYRAGPMGLVREVAERRGDYFQMTYRLPLLGTDVVPMRRRRDGVFTQAGGREYLLLKFPMRAGDRWRVDVPGRSRVADCEVLGIDEVEFAGRRAPATKLQVTWWNRGSPKRTVDYEWYAPGVGLAKMQVTYGVRATFTLERFEHVR